jgi:hypothetical protein
MPEVEVNIYTEFRKWHAGAVSEPVQVVPANAAIAFDELLALW